MVTAILLIILAVIVTLYLLLWYAQSEQSTNTQQPTPTPDAVEDKKLLSLTETTLAQRQRYYNRGFRQQMQYDELQRRAEAFGDTATLEAIRLETYDGPLPTLPEEIQNPLKVVVGSNKHKDAPVKKLKYFCVKDKGYHVSVWPKDYDQFDIVEFSITGLTHTHDVNRFLGEHKGILQPEPTNVYDPNAIEVLSKDGSHVGYVPSNTTSYIREKTTLPCPCYFYIGSNNGTYFSDCFVLRK